MLNGSVLQEREGAEALFDQAIEIVLERRPRRTFRLWRKWPADDTGKVRLRVVMRPGACCMQLNVGVLRGDARRGVGAHASVDVTVFVERARAAADALAPLSAPRATTRPDGSLSCLP